MEYTPPSSLRISGRETGTNVFHHRSRHFFPPSKRRGCPDWFQHSGERDAHRYFQFPRCWLPRGPRWSRPRGVTGDASVFVSWATVGRHGTGQDCRGEQQNGERARRPANHGWYHDGCLPVMWVIGPRTQHSCSFSGKADPKGNRVFRDFRYVSHDGRPDGSPPRSGA